MNPWIIVSWLGAVSVSFVIIAFTISVARSFITDARKKPSTEIFKSTPTE